MFSLISVMVDCTFFLLHMSYYVIAHYIQLLFIHFDVTEDGEIQINKSKWYIII